MIKTYFLTKEEFYSIKIKLDGIIFWREVKDMIEIEPLLPPSIDIIEQKIKNRKIIKSN